LHNSPSLFAQANPVFLLCRRLWLLIDSPVGRIAYDASSGVIPFRCDGFEQCSTVVAEALSSCDYVDELTLLLGSLLPGRLQRGFVPNYPHEFNDLASCRIAI
jgi:hypothetical protein